MTPRTRATLALAAAIVLGVVLGATGERLWTGRRPPDPMDTSTLVTAMDQRLHLDSVQRVAITRALTRHQAAVNAAWAAVQPSIRAAIDSSQTEILRVLRPDQRGPYLAWLAAAHGHAGSGHAGGARTP